MPVLTKSIDCIISIRQLSVPYNLAIHMMLIIPSFYQKPIIFRILRAALAARDRKIYIIIFSFFDVNSIKCEIYFTKNPKGLHIQVSTFTFYRHYFSMKKKNLLIGKKPKIESKSVGLMCKKCSDQFDLNSFFRTIMILKVV